MAIDMSEYNEISSVKTSTNEVFNFADTSLRETVSQLSSNSSTITIDGDVSDLSIANVTIGEYKQLLSTRTILSNELYVIRNEGYVDAYGEQIKHVSPGTDLSDAVNLQQLSDAISCLDAENIWEACDSVDSAKRKITTATPVVTGSESTVISQGALATGVANVAGLKGYRYTNTGSVTNSLTFTTAPTGWAVGDVVSIINDSKYPDCATISSISETTVTFNENLPFDTIIEDNGWDAKVAYVIEKPGVGDVDIGFGAYAEGLGTKALNAATHTEGRETTALGQYAHAEGRQTTAGYAAHAEGQDTKASGFRSHAEGYDTESNGSGAHAEGQHTRAHGQASHSEGHSKRLISETVANSANASIVTEWNSEKFALAKGTAAHVEGKDNLALGEESHAEGFQNVAQGYYAHAEGQNNTVTKTGGHAEGTGNTVNGENGHAEGSGNTVGTNANRAHAEGSGTSVTANNSHAEGISTTASGNSGHAEGANTLAGTGTRPSINSSTTAGNFSHAEGNGTQASGNSSHAEGKHTLAVGPYSHVEGLDSESESTANYAHAEGRYTIVKNQGEHAQGQFNKSNKANTTFGNAGNTIHSIGIGDANNNRKNAVEVMQNGKVYIKDVGGYNGTNPTAANVKDLATFVSSKLEQNDVNISYSNQTIWLSSKAYVTSVDCADFIKDGMLSSAELCGTQLIFKFNTEADSQPISVELSTFVDNYDSTIEEISNKIDNKIIIDNRISAIVDKSDLSVIKLSASEYEQLVYNDGTLSNALYIVEKDYLDQYGQQIKNLGAPTDLSDATTKEYVDNLISLQDFSKIFIDNRISSVFKQTDLSIIKLSSSEYEQLVYDDQTLSDALYIVEDNKINAYGSQIKNVFPGTDLSDAATVGQVITNINTSLSTVLANKTYDMNQNGILTAMIIDLVEAFGGTIVNRPSTP